MTQYGPDSRAPAVKVLNYFLLVTSILAVLVRLSTKLLKLQRLFRDDYFIIASLVLSIGQTVAVAVEVNNGYGERRAKLDDRHIDAILRAEYSATLLYIASMCLSKLSLASFVGYLTPSSRERTLSVGVHAVIGVWAVIGIFATAFQCHPHPWSYLSNSCFNREAWFTYLGISNILTDLAIVAHAVKIIAGIQTNRERKASLVFVFSSRIIVVGAIICRIVLLDRAMAAHDPTRDTWPANIATQLVQCLSIVTASVPQLIPFLRNLNSSGMDLAGITRHMATSHPKSTKSSRAGKTYIWSPSGRSRSGKGSSGYELDYVRRPKNKAVVTNVSKGDNDGESQSSQVGIIRETVSWTVTEERRNSLDRGRGDGEGNNGGHGLW